MSHQLHAIHQARTVLALTSALRDDDDTFVVAKSSSTKNPIVEQRVENAPVHLEEGASLVG